MLVLSTETPAAIAIITLPQTTAPLCPTLCRNIANNLFDSVVASPNYQFDIITMSKVEFNTTGYLLDSDSVVSVVMSRTICSISPCPRLRFNTAGYQLNSVAMSRLYHDQVAIFETSDTVAQQRVLSTFYQLDSLATQSQSESRCYHLDNIGRTIFTFSYPHTEQRIIAIQ